MRKSTTHFIAALILSMIVILSLASPVFGDEGNNEKDKTTTTHNKNQTPNKRIVVFSLPRVTWDTLAKANTPHIDSLISQGAVAALSVRVLGSPTLAKSYATLSAGIRATAVEPSTAVFLAPDELLGGDRADTIFFNQRGSTSIKKPAALGLGFQTVLRANETSLNEAQVGLLAQTLHGDDKTIAVFGNADKCLDDKPDCRERSLAYFGSNTNGVLEYGDVSTELLEPLIESESTQLALDNDVVAKKAKASISVHDVTAIECSDLERIDAARTTTKETVSDDNEMNALAKCDELVGEVLQSLSLSRDQIYIVSPNAPRSLEQTTVFVAAGKGIDRGYATSATTRMKAAVSIIDLAPTILKSFDISRPETMGDTLIAWEKSSASNETRVDFLVRINEQAVVREAATKPTTWFVTISFVAMVLVSMISIARSQKWKHVSRFVCFMSFSMPILTYLLQPVMFRAGEPAKFMIILGIVSAFFAGVLVNVAKKWGNQKAILGLSGFTLAVLVIDILLGGNLQFNSVFGNGSIQSGRFAGWGNSSFAFVGVSALVIVAMAKEVSQSRDQKKMRRLNGALIGLLFTIIVIDGAPYFGSDVGGVLALTPTAIFVGMMLYGKRVSIRTLLLSCVATIAAISAFALVDLARPVAERTHLGRFAESLIEGRAGVTIKRKMAASIASFERPELTIVAAISIAYFLYLIFHHKKYLHKVIEDHPNVRLLILPGIILAILGTLLNDSGLSIPARMLLIAVPVITLLAQDKNVDQGQESAALVSTSSSKDESTS